MRYLESLRLRNFLSFGHDSGRISLGHLNVIIGPNGSGKSNLIEAIRLLRACGRNDLAQVIREGGGFREWLWKGGDASWLELELELAPTGLRHHLRMAAVEQSFETIEERVEKAKKGKAKPAVLYARDGIRAVVRRSGKLHAVEQLQGFPTQPSAIGRFIDYSIYPDLWNIWMTYSNASIYQDWRFGRNSPVRLPQPTDFGANPLAEDGRNLGLVISALRKDPAAKEELGRWLGMLYEGVKDVDVEVTDSTVRVYLQEQGWTVPATRLSEGTLRWLCLVAIALRNGMQTVVCIEEPETGLHPDLLPSLAELLRQASKYMQLIVTTHSDVLVDALTDTPESILVCDKEDGQTKLRRLNRKKLGTWLDKYRLGELWRSGQIGGNRW